MRSALMDEKIYLNGAIIAADQARISALDYGFLYGYGLFETMRAYEGTVFRLDSHLTRLKKSAGFLGISTDMTALKKAVHDILKLNKLEEARIRITLSAGVGSTSPDPGTCFDNSVLVVAVAYRPYEEYAYQNGFKAVVPSSQRNSCSPLSRIKSISYLENMLARQEARKAGADEAVWLNEKGVLAEGSMSNIFVVSGGIIKTPSEESGILPGITRQVVLQLAQEAGIEVAEGEFDLDELKCAEEAFLTSSLIEVMPLTILDGMPIGNGKPGPVTIKLLKSYRYTVSKETGRLHNQ